MEKPIGEERRCRPEEIGVVDASFVMDAIVAVSIAAGASFAVIELREMRQDRRTRLVLDVMEMLFSREIMKEKWKLWRIEFKDGKEAEEKCGLELLGAVINYYEALGYLVERGLVDREAVFEVMSIAVWWDKMKPWVLSESVRGSDSLAYTHFERAAAMEREWEAKKKRKGV